MSNADDNNLDLQPPDLLNAENGVIDMGLMRGSPVVVQVNRWKNVHVTDVITVHFGNAWHSWPVLDDSQAFFWIEFEEDEIPDGYYDNVYYTVKNGAGIWPSPPAPPVTVKGSPASEFPPPFYPDEDIKNGGVVYFSAIVENGGLVVVARYTMMYGDSVTFYWSGQDSDGGAVPAATYTSDPISVGDDEFNAGYVKTTIPSSHVLCLGSKGKGQAYYVVTRTNGGGSSPPQKVILSFAHMDSSDVNVTTGAQVWASDMEQTPLNWVNVFGPPGMAMTATVDHGCMITEANEDNGKGLSFRFGPDGFMKFSAYSTSYSAQLTITSDEGFLPPNVKPLVFTDPFTDPTSTLFYSYTNSAPNDFETPCSVYVFVDRDLTTATHVDVTVDNNALIDTYRKQTASVPLSDKGYATVDIIDTEAESVNVTLTLSGGNVQDPPGAQFTVGFVPFPSWKADAGEG